MLQSGIFCEIALSLTMARARAKDSMENATAAEKSDIWPATDLRVKEMQKEPEAEEHTKTLGGREDSKKRAKESGK